LLNKPMVRL